MNKNPYPAIIVCSDQTIPEEARIQAGQAARDYFDTNGIEDELCCSAMAYFYSNRQVLDPNLDESRAFYYLRRYYRAIIAANKVLNEQLGTDSFRLSNRHREHLVYLEWW